MDFTANVQARSIFALSFSGLIGLLIGSFYTATASRVLYYFYGPGRKNPRRISEFFFRPSFCMKCHKPILWRDLIPVTGYIGVRGRCRHCGNSIGVWTYIGELLPAILLPLLLFSGLSWPSSLASILLLGHLYISFVTDYHFHLLDHENAVFIAGWALFAVWFDGGMEMLKTAMLSGITIFGMFMILYLIAGYKRMGFGDVILGSILAIYAGFPWVILLFNLAAGTSVIYSLLLLKDRRTPIPFGVFLSISAWITTLVHAVFRIWMK